MGIFTGRPLKVVFARKKAPPKRGLSRGYARTSRLIRTPDRCIVYSRDGATPAPAMIKSWLRGPPRAVAMMSGGRRPGRNQTKPLTRPSPPRSCDWQNGDLAFSTPSPSPSPSRSQSMYTSYFSVKREIGLMLLCLPPLSYRRYVLSEIPHASAVSSSVIPRAIRATRNLCPTARQPILMTRPWRSGCC